MNAHLAGIIAITLSAIIISVISFYSAKRKKSRGDVVPNEEESWKWGIIYYNPADSRIWVQKKSRLGYTLNFARPISVIIILVITLLTVLAVVLKIK